MSERRESEYVANQHLHLTGALDMKYLRSVSAKNGLLAEKFGLLNPSDFDDPAVWALAKYLTSTPAGFEAAIDHVVTTQKQENVTRVELTFNPYGMIQRGMTPGDIAQIAHDSVEAARAQDVMLLLRPGVNRKDGPESVALVHEVFQEMPADTRLGIDLNGDERLYPTKPFLKAFGTLVEHGVPVALHAGEFADQQQSLRHALSIRPQRIGHAVAAASNPQLLNELAESGSTVEVALTSNLVRGVVASIEQHPVREFVSHGVPVVLGTDDPAFFGNSMADEFVLLNKAGVSWEEIA